MTFNYFIGEESEQFTFVKVPKLFFTDKRFEILSYGAKILYGLLLDRMSLSKKNRWRDDQHRIYVIYTIESIQEDFHVSKTLAVRFLKELEDFGLIEKRRRPNAAAMIYVKNFVLPDPEVLSVPEEAEVGETAESRGGPEHGIPEVQNMEVQNMDFRKRQENQGSPFYGSPETGIPEVHKMESNKTDINNKYILLSSSSIKEDEVKEILREEIYYERTIKKYDVQLVDQALDCLKEVFLSEKQSYKIDSREVPAREVRKTICENLNESSFSALMNNILKNGPETIFHLKAYIVACFFHLLCRPTRTKATRAGSTFHDFQQNEYDFTSLEKQLLEKN